MRVIGCSHSHRAVLTIILVRRDDGGLYGANDWKSNSSVQRRYEGNE